MSDPDFQDLPHALRLWRGTERDGRQPYAQVTLSYDDRFLRRRRLVTDAGEGVFVNLAEVTSLDEGDAFELADGRLVAIAAAVEPVIVVTGPNLAALAWHIGNRHTPCQVEADRLVIRADHVLEAMLRQLGAEVTHRMEPFHPLGGAYGHGRTMGHDHGPAHAHGPGGHNHEGPSGGPLMFPRAAPLDPVPFERPAKGPFAE
jgi:urease accessory protein